jgi:hypothetical protein
MMKYPQLSTSLLALLLTLSVSGLHASEKAHEHDHDHEQKHEEGHDHERVQHGAHEHGAAKLSLAVGDDGVDIMLASPAANLVGFEYIASSDEDKQKLRDVKAKLEAGADLFSINDSAQCELKETTLASAQLDALHDHADEEKHADHDEHEHEDHDEYGHKEKHDDHDEYEHKEKHAEHDDEDGHKHKEGETHSDIDVTWSFACAKPENIEEVNIKLFSAFPGGFEHVQAEWITATGASAKELAEDTTLKLK